jgi:hypothetical protein
MEFTMNNDKLIPDAETRARNVARWQEVCLMLDHVNVILEQTMAQAEYDLQNSPLYVHRRERIRKQLLAQKQQLV